MMRSRLLLRTFLAISLFTGVAMQLTAKTYSQKTFLAPRAVGTNLPMELTTWHEYSYQKLERRQGHKIRGHIVATPFYQASDEKDDLGKYFGIGNGQNSFVVGNSAEVAAETANINGFNLVHSFDPAVADKLGGTVKFSPKQEIWGARLDYFQDIDHPFAGLFFKASMPIVYVENNVSMDVSDETNLTVDNKTFSVKDFFAGNVELTSDNTDVNLQSPLTHAKITGRESKFGVADINLALGYKIHQSKSSHVFLSAQAIIPTGPRPNGEHLWGPVMGNGKHFGLGARLDSAIQLWSNKHAAVRFLFDVDYRYLFESTEHRTLGVKDETLKLSHYYLAGRIGQEDQPLFPAANILTQHIRVKPGNQFDILADLTFKSSGFVLDFGYNFFYKDEEDCWRKDSWEDGVYALANADYPTNVEFTAAHSLKTLNESDLDVSAVETPSQVTHKVFAGLGYDFDITKRFPALVGIGGSYEFVSDNSALECYAVWLKFGVSF